MNVLPVDRKRKTLTAVITILASLAVGFFVGKSMEPERNALTRSGSNDPTRFEGTGATGARKQRSYETNSSALPSSADSRDGFEAESRANATVLHLENVLEGAAKDRVTEYGQVFTELGIPEERHAQLIALLNRIHRSSLQAEVAASDFLKNRKKYQEELWSILSPSDYDRYRAYERRKVPIHELGMLEEFAEKTGAPPLTGAVADRLLSAIEVQGIHSAEKWHGPFDEVPSPAYGGEMVARKATEEIERLRAQIPGLLKTAQEMGCSAGEQALLADYFTSRIEEKGRVLGDAILFETDKEAWREKHEEVVDAIKAKAARGE